jgi:hypothetical protein
MSMYRRAPLGPRPMAPQQMAARRMLHAPTGNLLPPAILPVAICCLLISLTGTNTALGLASAILLLVGSAMLYRPGESPVLLFIFGYQWLQISAVIFHASWLGINIDNYGIFPGLDLETTAAMSLAALFLLACGIRLGMGAYRSRDADVARSIASSWPTERWFWLYAASWLVASMSQSAAWIVPGLSQPLLALANLKWAFFLILTYSVFASPRSRVIYWAAAFGLELVMSLGGFFSDFKTVFFFSIFGIVAAQVRLQPRAYLGMAVLGAMLFVFAVVWTAIKPAYRDYASGGTGQQVVKVEFSDRLSKLSELIGSVDGTVFSEGADKLIRRLGYLDFFAATMAYVPRVMTYEDGAIWADAIARPFMPRMFFPNKTEIHDSERTNKYTGAGIAGADAGTSISIGYMGETYIDFGPWGMMGVIAIFGFTLGRLYRFFLTSPKTRGVLGLGLSTAVMFVMTPIETSITKSVGGIIVSFIMAWLLVTFVIPTFARWTRA